MNPQSTYLKITRIPYEEPSHVKLIVSASNGEQSGSLEIYDGAASLLDTATALTDFPFNQQSYTWELGSEDPKVRFGFYFLFEVKLIDPQGHAFIHFRMNNNEDLPDKAMAEFSIRTEIAGINRLGNLFQAFARLDSEQLTWDGSNGEIA